MTPTGTQWVEPIHIFRVLAEVDLECARQNEKWGEQNHGDGTGRSSDDLYAMGQKRRTDAAARGGYLTWRDVLAEEVAEAFAESDPTSLCSELIQVAAVAVQWVMAINRRTA